MHIIAKECAYILVKIMNERHKGTDRYIKLPCEKKITIIYTYIYIYVKVIERLRIYIYTLYIYYRLFDLPF